MNDMTEDHAAYAIDLDADWVEGLRFANRLVRGGQRVLLVDRILAGPAAEPPLAPGALVVPVSPALDAGLLVAVDADELRGKAAAAGVGLRPLGSEHRVVASPLTPVVAGLYGGGGAPFNQASLLAECGFEIRFLSDADIRAGALDEVDILVVPGGGFRAMVGQLEPLGEAGCRAIADWVRRGGMYVGSCAGAYDCSVAPDDFVMSCPAQRHLQLINARVWNDASVDFGALQSPGVGVVTVRNECPGHPVMFGLPEAFDIVHYNGPIFDPLPIGAIDGASLAVGLASFAGWTSRFTLSEDFAGPRRRDGPTLLERAIENGRFSVVAGGLGTGRVVAFGSHPEFGDDLAMVRWGQPGRMLANAVLWQSVSRPAGVRRSCESFSAAPIGFPAGAGFAAIPSAVAAVQDRAAALQRHPIEPQPTWLAPEYALSLFGATPVELWQGALTDLVRLGDEIAGAAERLRDTVAEVVATAPDNEDLRATVVAIERWVLDERPPEWEQDGGYQGVLALMTAAVGLCDQALADWEIELGQPAGPYGYFRENPYHLVAGSYLAAIGCVAGAHSLLRAATAELALARQLAADGRSHADRDPANAFATAVAAG